MWATKIFSQFSFLVITGWLKYTYGHQAWFLPNWPWLLSTSGPPRPFQCQGGNKSHSIFHLTTASSSYPEMQASRPEKVTGLPDVPFKWLFRFCLPWGACTWLDRKKGRHYLIAQYPAFQIFPSALPPSPSLPDMALFYTFLSFFFFFFWAHHWTCGILVPWPGIQPISPAES